MEADWRDELILREMETIGPEPERSDAGPWTPAALDRLLADVQASPATADIDRYLLAQMAEKHAMAQLVVHGLRAQVNGLVAELSMARSSRARMTKTALEADAHLCGENAELRGKLRAALANSREAWRVASCSWLAAVVLVAVVLAARWAR